MVCGCYAVIACMGIVCLMPTWLAVQLALTAVLTSPIVIHLVRAFLSWQTTAVIQAKNSSYVMHSNSICVSNLTDMSDHATTYNTSLHPLAITPQASQHCLPWATSSSLFHVAQRMFPLKAVLSRWQCYQTHSMFSQVSLLTSYLEDTWSTLQLC
jgi:hypothetical protein